jgi:hypothetical protein
MRPRVVGVSNQPRISADVSFDVMGAVTAQDLYDALHQPLYGNQDRYKWDRAYERYLIEGYSHEEAAHWADRDVR